MQKKAKATAELFQTAAFLEAFYKIFNITITLLESFF